MSGEFAAFRVMRYALPFTPEAAGLQRDCLNWYIRRSGKPIGVAERALALYKLKTEMKT